MRFFYPSLPVAAESFQHTGTAGSGRFPLHQSLARGSHGLLVSLLILLGLMTGCASMDDSGQAVAAHWRSRFKDSNGQPTMPWENGTAVSIDAFVYEGIAVKDYEYKRYVDLLRRGTSWSGFGAQTIALGLNTAGSLTVAGTTQILSAAAGAVNGTSAAFSKHILFDQSVTTFVGRMDALRAEKIKYIQKRLKDGNYSYAEGYRDVEDYGHLGSLDAALADVSKGSGVKQAVAEGDIKPVPKPTATPTGKTPE